MVNEGAHTHTHQTYKYECPAIGLIFPSSCSFALQIWPKLPWGTVHHLLFKSNTVVDTLDWKCKLSNWAAGSFSPNHFNNKMKPNLKLSFQNLTPYPLTQKRCYCFAPWNLQRIDCTAFHTNTQILCCLMIIHKISIADHSMIWADVQYGMAQTWS